MSCTTQKLQENEVYDPKVTRKWVVQTKSYKKTSCTTQKLQENELYNPKVTRKCVVRPKIYKKMSRKL